MNNNSHLSTSVETRREEIIALAAKHPYIARRGAGATLRAGQEFGRLKLVACFKYTKGVKWLCDCLCGGIAVVTASCIQRGRTASCGCYRSERRLESATRHGCAKRSGRTPEWIAWRAMLSRCNNPHNKNYDRYGARGISVYSSWSKFENFFADMGPKPSLRHSIDRIDNDGNYEPGNCRWATRREQGNNTARNRRITHNGVTKTVSEWAVITGLHMRCILGRLRRGWPPEMALSARDPRAPRIKPAAARAKLIPQPLTS